MHEAKPIRTLEAAAVLLFLLQSIRVLFSVLFGLIYDAIFEETLPISTLGAIMVLVVAAFISPLGSPRRKARTLLLATAIVASLARIAVTINQPWVRLWSSLVVVASAALYAATLYRRNARSVPTALLLAFAADQFLRVAGNTYDLALRPLWLPVQVGLTLATGFVAWRAYSRSASDQTAPSSPQGGITLSGSLALGALLFLETSLLGFPNALARWSGVAYEVVAPLLLAATLLPAVPAVRRFVRPLERHRFGGPIVLLLAAVGVAAGRLAGPAAALAGMLAAQALVILTLLATADSGTSRRGGRPLAVGLLLFLLLSFGLAFAFTYPYVIPAFRDMGLPIAVVAAVISSLPSLRRQSPEAVPHSATAARWHLPVAALAVLASAAFALPPRMEPWDGGPIRVGTYNIHYGYDTHWQLSLEDQARTIEESGVDIIFMQEVDACRITSYGVDNALWLSRRLGMQEVFGPALEELSGIALLSRIPISESDTRLLASELEQTAIVHAQTQVRGQTLHAYGVWFGLEPEERARQLDDALGFIGDASPAVFGGDMNADPDSETYARLLAAGFEDPFIAGGFELDPTSPAIRPSNRIDYVWIRGLVATDAGVLASLASDHRMVVIEVTLP